MQKKHYLKELSLSKTQKKSGSNSKKEVLKIQSWLCLHEKQKPGIGTMTSIDGDFGPATEGAVKNFQKEIGLSESGQVTPSLFSEMTKPMKVAFEGAEKQNNLRDTILEVANKHLNQRPFELVIDGERNSGPWVRSYMGSNDGEYWYWCMGFVQMILDQSLSLHGKNFKEIMPITYSCDTVGMKGLEHGCLIRNKEIKLNPNKIKPGDILLIRKSKFDWTHTAIITEVGSDTFTTIEGNTNQAGSRNGDGVYKRVRNFITSKLDVFSINNWAKELDFTLRMLRLKSRGEAVLFLENRLVELGYSDVIVSSYFGVSTELAVKDFQNKNDLLDDGIVGPKTWTALLD